jgi:uncharacterized protein YuzE
MAAFEITFDREVNAAYIRLTDGDVATTREVVPDNVWVDIDASGHFVGLEAINVEHTDLPGLLEELIATLRAASERLTADGERADLMEICA